MKVRHKNMVAEALQLANTQNSNLIRFKFVKWRFFKLFFLPVPHVLKSRTAERQPAHLFSGGRFAICHMPCWTWLARKENLKTIQVFWSQMYCPVSGTRLAVALHGSSNGGGAFVVVVVFTTRRVVLCAWHLVFHETSTGRGTKQLEASTWPPFWKHLSSGPKLLLVAKLAPTEE